VLDIELVVLSGGSGTRLWPASRESYPKQLLALNGELSLLQETVLRLRDFIAGRVGVRPLVVTNEEYRFIVAEQLRAVGNQGARIILEPVGRNTAPALTLAAHEARESDADPVLLVMPADHVIVDVTGFQAAVEEGGLCAQEGAVVAFGVIPDRPETGYGYIRSGGPISGKSKAQRLEEFVEKPGLAVAEQYVNSGAYYWNSGIFMVKASVWLSAMELFRPDILEACKEAFGGRTVDEDFVRVEKGAFAACPSDSIDYAVMERLALATDLGPSVVVPMSVGWSDVGAWDALWAVSAQDENGNVSKGEVLFEGCRDTLVHSGSRLVAAIGCEDMVVVETPDAVLVANKARTQDVKKVVERLKAEGRSLAQSHRKVYRPWGWYDSIDFGERFQVKRIVVEPGARLSLQMHHHRAEHWIVVKGTAEVTCNDRVFLLGENESTYIPLGHTHRLCNPGKVPLEIIEVQSGSYLGEDDIVRFEDTYGRAV